MLADIQAENRGRLTVFLGAAAGVGKTFEMLQAARERLMEGVDVVVGWVEPHDRPETAALLDGLPQIPPKTLSYRGKELREPDIDAIIERKPALVLIDELAHTNAPGMRHLKRYQDVQELLTAGIDVFTTLNIQHLESLNDVVRQITGVEVRETVPDRILEDAHIQLVDIPPEQLIQRLKDGKVYRADVAALALERFFRPGNIDALRELSMRYAAQRVDRQMESYRRTKGISERWAAAERVMVAVSSNPFSQQLVRIGRRMASGLKADLLVVFVDTPRSSPASEAARDRLAKTMRLAEQLGAETITVSGENVADSLLDVARKRNVTHLIIGKSLQKPRWRLFRRSPVDSLIEKNRDISIHVIPTNPVQSQASPRPAGPSVSRPGAFHPSVLAGIIVVTTIGWLWRAPLGLVNVAMLYLLPIVYAASKGGMRNGLLAALLSSIAYDFFFVPPRFTIATTDVRYLLSFAILILIGLLTGQLSDRLHNQVATARLREDQTSILYALSREMTAVAETGPVLASIVRKVAETLDAQVAVLLPDSNGRLELRACSEPAEGCFLDESERAVASWAFEHAEPAGRGTETLGGARAHYLPMIAEERPVGILAVRLRDGEDHQRPETRRLLEAFSNLGGMAVTRLALLEKAREAKALEESEKLSTALLNSISHDLRTPLAAMIGAVTGLLEDGELFDAAAREDLLRTIKQAALRMNRLVNNMLHMARLESGVVKLNRQWCDIEDIVGGAMRRVADSIRTHPVRMNISTDLPLVIADCTLIEQVLANLLDNANKYSDSHSRITVTARAGQAEIELSVANEASRIPPGDLGKIFEKFYRLSEDKDGRGTGLGLAVAKSIVEVHGGRIWATTAEDGTFTISFILPLTDQVPPEVPEGRGGGRQDG